MMLARIFAVETWGAFWNLENALGCTVLETDDVIASKKKHTQILEPKPCKPSEKEGKKRKEGLVKEDETHQA